MKQKFVIISMALIISILVGCSAKQTEPAPKSEPTVEQTVQDQSVTEPTTETISTEQGEDAIDIMDDESMYLIFESVFEYGAFIRSTQNNKDTLQDEIDNLAAFQTQTLKFKEGYQDEYIKWRNEKLEAQMKAEEKAPEKEPEKAPSGGNTNSSSNTGGNSGSANNSESTGSVGPNSPMSSEYDPSADPNRMTDEEYEEMLDHLKNEGITIGGSGD